MQKLFISLTPTAASERLTPPLRQEPGSLITADVKQPPLQKILHKEVVCLNVTHPKRAGVLARNKPHGILSDEELFVGRDNPDTDFGIRRGDFCLASVAGNVFFFVETDAEELHVRADALAQQFGVLPNSPGE